MKILLINPSDKKYLVNAGDRPPLGLCYVASALLKERKIFKHKVKIIDMNHNNEDDLRNKVEVFKPDIVGIGFTTPQYHEARNLAIFVKSINNQIKIIAGGVHPTLEVDIGDIFDGVVMGEYDKKYYPNILPARHLLNMDNYNMMIDGERTATLISSRGCSGSCIYCSRINGREVRGASAKQIFKEMYLLYNKYNYRSFYFLDDTFTYNSERINILCKMIKFSSMNNNISIRITSRADLIRENDIKSLSKVGLKIVSLGIEHADNDVLRKAGKRMTIEDNLKAIKIIKRYKVKVKGFFIINLPGANDKTINKTIKFAKKYCHYYDFYPLTAFPGTPLWLYPKKFGMRILSRDYNFWEAGKNIKLNIDSKKLPAKKVIKILERLKR